MAAMFWTPAARAPKPDTVFRRILDHFRFRNETRPVYTTIPYVDYGPPIIPPGWPTKNKGGHK